MKATEIIVVVVWVAFWAYWLGAAAFVKRGGQLNWSRQLGIRAVLAVIVIVLLRAGLLRSHSHSSFHIWRAFVGIAVLLTGLGFAIWARRHIGRNWGVPMTRKVDPELVTSGPYHLVRHPIYSGILFGGVGTAVALGWFWFIAVGLVAVYFVYSATVEERYMTTQFPDVYPGYKQSTKMLVPFIF